MLDRRLIGKCFSPTMNEIEKGAIRRFAQAIGDTNPLYHDEEVARSAGFRGLLAPPTFPSALSGGVDWKEILKIKERSILIGEQSFEHHLPICAGDRLLVTTRVVDIYEKSGSGGVMDFAVVEEEGLNEQKELVYRSRRTIVARPPLRIPEESSLP